MEGANIDINQSLSAQSSNNEPGFVESGQTNAGLLHSLACVGNGISTPGVDDVRNSDPSTYKPEEIGIISNEVGTGCGDPVDGLKMGFKDDRISNLVKRLSSDFNSCRSGNLSEKSVSNPIFVDKGHDERNFDNKERNILKNPQDKWFHTPTKQRSMDNFFLLGTPEAPEEYKCPLQSTNLKDKINFGKPHVDKIEIYENKGKGKEKVFQTASSESFLKGLNDSHESVESTNSKRPISFGKRDSCFEMDSNSGCSKRFKKLNDEVSLSRPVLGENGSFFNWIVNVAKGISNNVSSEKSLMLARNPPLDGRITNSLVPLSHDEDKDLNNRTGFGSFVKAMYRPNLPKIETSLTAIHDFKREVGHVAMEPSNHWRHHVRRNREGFKVLQPDPLSALRTGNCQFGDFSPENVRNSTSSNSPFRGSPQYSCNEHRDIYDGGSSSSSTRNGSIPVHSISPSSRFSSSGSEFLGTSWITRLSSRSSRKVLLQSNRDKSSAGERPVYNCKYLPQIQNADHHHEESRRFPPSEDWNDATRDQKQTTAPDSCFPKGAHNDQKLKCKLNTIVPSPTLKKLEPITSVFAKRVDAFRQIKSSRAADAKVSNLMCFFCGTTGHDITICPEVNTFERDDLLKSTGLCNWPQGSTSLCIRCFRLNHWAVVCPYMSLKSKHSSGSTFQTAQVNFESEQKYHTKNLYLSDNGSKLRLSKDDSQQKLTASDGFQCVENSTFRADSMHPLNFRNLFSGVQSSNPTGKDLQRDKMKDESHHF